MKIHLCLIVLILIVSGCFTQYSYPTANEQALKIHPEYRDYYNEFMEEGEVKLAVSYTYLKTQLNDGTYKIRTFFPETKQIVSEEIYRSKAFKVLEGPSKTWFEINGDLRDEGQYQNGKKTGKWTSYFNEKISTGNYTNGEKTGTWKVHDKAGRICEEKNYTEGLTEVPFIKYDTLGNAYEQGIYKADTIFQKETLIPKGKRAIIEEEIVIIDEMPEYPGGQRKMLEFLYGNIRYPAKAREYGVEGMCVISFVVDTDGNLIGFEVRRGICEPLQEECLRVIKQMPKWKPGYVDGEPVRVSYNLPVRFKLQ